MYKKILVLIIGLSFVLRALPMSIYFIGGRDTLPLAVLGFTGIMIIVSLYVMAKFLIKGISIKEIIAYLSLDFIAVMFNLIYAVVIASVGTTDIVDTLIVGNVLVLVLDPILIYFGFKKDKYISISDKVVSSATELEADEKPLVNQCEDVQQKEVPTKKEIKIEPTVDTKENNINNEDLSVKNNKSKKKNKSK